MKIVNFIEFCKCPEGSIFSYYNPEVFIGLWRKDRTLFDKEVPVDYFQESLLPVIYNGNIEIGTRERWGEFDYEQMYAVYEEEDLWILKDLIK